MLGYFVDTGAASAASGVVGVFTHTDLGLVPAPSGRRTPAVVRHALAADRVRFVGEAVAVVVADTVVHAADAAETVMVDYDARPAGSVDILGQRWRAVRDTVVLTLPQFPDLSWDAEVWFLQTELPVPFSISLFRKSITFFASADCALRM